MAFENWINLNSTDSRSRPILNLRRQPTVSIHIIPATWGSAVVRLQAALDETDVDVTTNWFDVYPTVEFGSGRPARMGILLPPADAFRLATVTADGSASATAPVRVPFSTQSVVPGLRSQLGQLRPGDTNAASLYSPAPGVRTEVDSVWVSETSGTDRTFRLFLDDDGSTYDETTALLYDVSIGANTTVEVAPDYPWAMANALGNLAARSSSASALIFTAYGTEF